jgi:hypothetical protein
MILRWLLGVLPRDLARGWRLLTPDLGVWCLVAAALVALAHVGPALPSPSPPAQGAPAVPTQAPALGVVADLLRVAAPLLILVAAASRFEAHDRGDSTTWRATARSVRRRSLPAITAWLAAAAICLIVAMIAQVVMLALARPSAAGNEGLRALSGLLRTVVFTVLLARFAFVPFLAVLERHEDFAQDSSQGPLWRLWRRAGWPLWQSSRRTEPIRRLLLPYLALWLYAPLGAALAPAVMRAPASFLLHVLSFTALAVLFSYYADRERELPG